MPLDPLAPKPPRRDSTTTMTTMTPPPPTRPLPATPTTGSSASTGGRHGSPLLSLLNRFGTNAPKSEQQRVADVAYREGREAAFDQLFPELVASQAPFDLLLLRAHKTLNDKKEFSTIVRLSALVLGNNLHAGEFRTGPNRAGQYLAPSSKDVPVLMASFGAAVDRLLPTVKDDEGARLVAAWVLTAMIRVHPFMDGNGRTARAAMNLVLARTAQRTIDFPADSEGVYKKSPVWARLKDHMRAFVGPQGLGWTMQDGMVPPRGYFGKLRGLLVDEMLAATVAGLAERSDIVALADALRHARDHGFGP